MRERNGDKERWREGVTRRREGVTGRRRGRSRRYRKREEDEQRNIIGRKMMMEG